MEAPLIKRIVAVLSSLGGGDLLDRGSYELYLRTVVIILANWVADKSHFTHQLDGQEAVLEELYSEHYVSHVPWECLERDVYESSAYMWREVHSKLSQRREPSSAPE